MRWGPESGDVRYTGGSRNTVRDIFYVDFYNYFGESGLVVFENENQFTAQRRQSATRSHTRETTRVTRARGRGPEGVKMGL